MKQEEGLEWIRRICFLSETIGWCMICVSLFSYWCKYNTIISWVGIFGIIFYLIGKAKVDFYKRYKRIREGRK